jgi:hypothetical protein
LVVLGDLLEYADYDDPEKGIVGSVFEAEVARMFAFLRSAGSFERVDPSPLLLDRKT